MTTIYSVIWNTWQWFTQKRKTASKQNRYKSEAIQVIEIGEVLQLGWYLTDNVQGVDFSAQANMPKHLRDKRRKRYEFVRACINQTGNLVSFQNQMSMTWFRATSWDASPSQAFRRADGEPWVEWKLTVWWCGRQWHCCMSSRTWWPGWCWGCCRRRWCRRRRRCRARRWCSTPTTRAGPIAPGSCSAPPLHGCTHTELCTQELTENSQRKT